MKDQRKTPGFANFLLRLFCREEYLDEVKGDLEENYQWRLQEKGSFQAWFRYYLDAFSAIRLMNFDGMGGQALSRSMLYSFAKSSLRNFNRNRTYTFLNLFGLALGMAAALFILQYVSDELNYDRFSQADQIYRINQDFEQNNERLFRTARTEGTLASALVDNLPEIEEAARLIDYTWLWEGKNVFTLPDNPDKTFIESAAYFADPAIPGFFDLKLIQGKSRLEEPFTVLVSQEIAEKYFGTVENAIGQIIRFSSVKNKPELLVTGVYEFPKLNMQVKPLALISYSTFNKVIGEVGPHNMAGVESSLTYVKLREGTMLLDFRENLASFSSRRAADLEEINNGLRTGPLLAFMPVRDIHLHSRYPDEVGHLGDDTTVRMLILIAMLIVSIAWVNYINLATAHSLNRLKELGVRTVMGARKAEIVMQFFIEALLMNVLALGLALFMVVMAQELFNGFVQNRLSLESIDWMAFGLPAAVFFLIGVICSGMYPLTIFFSSATVSALKGKSKANHTGGLKKGLIVFQFLAGSLMIMATLVINRQLDFMNSKDKGMDMSRVLVLDGPTVTGTTWEEKRQKANLLINRLNELPNVLQAGVSTNIPGKPVVRGRKISRESHKDADSWRIKSVRGTAYLEILNLRFLAGSGFRQASAGNQTTSGEAEPIAETVLSQSALNQLGFESPTEALGKLLYGWTYSGSYPMKVVGVVEDYHHEGLKKEVAPMVFMPGEQWDYYYLVKLREDQLAVTLEEIENLYESVHQGNPANYYFLDEFFQRQYQSEDVNSKVLTAFTLVAILVACLGLFGLSSFVALQRTKEIGIRKVLGAGVRTVFYLLSKELILLATLGFVVAVPLGYLGMSRWLDGFAYHIPVSWSLFFVPLLVILALALLAISPRVLKTAVMNPVKSLRHE